MLVDIPIGVLVLASILFCLLVVCLYRLFKKRQVQQNNTRLAFELPWVTAYVMATFASLFVSWISMATLGVRSEAYLYLFFGQSYLLDFFILVILLSIYRLSSGRLGGEVLVLLLLPLLIVHESMSLDGTIIYRKVSNGLLSLKALFGMVVYWNLFRQPQVKLGSTWSGILKGIYIPCLLDWLNYTLYIFGLGSSFSFFSSVKPLVTIISWLLIAHALRSYDPPKSGGSNGIGSDKMRELVDRAASAARRIA